MKSNSGAWSLAGVAAGAAGIATSYFVAAAMTIRESPVVAVAEQVIGNTPGPVAEKAIDVLGSHDKSFLVVVILILLTLLFAWAGRLSRRSTWAPVVLFAVLTAVGALAVAAQRGATAVDAFPVAVGFVTWVVALSLLTEPLRRRELAAKVAVEAPRGDDARRSAALAVQEQTRRGFVLRAGLTAAGAVVLGGAGRVIGGGRRHVEQARALLKLSAVTPPDVPASAVLGVDGISAWNTSANGFYRIDTSIVTPTIDPTKWSLRIHGMVDREVVLTYDDLLQRETTEAWVTLNCVSNEIGGDLIGNAWWSGVRIAPLLAEAGVQDGAEAVLQTSDDGWTCGTPIEALTDDRDAMLAVAMNGKPLPIEHGFPVRSIVPGLYGYVSATKWVVDYEVTTYDRFSAFWTERGWSAKGPVKMSSRIDVPSSGDEVTAGRMRVGGVAWAQHTGIAAVQVAVDGGGWQPAEIAGTPSTDTWVQWAATIDVPAGDHVVRVRATDRDGEVQTAAVTGTVPNGSTGLHAVDFSAV